MKNRVKLLRLLESKAFGDLRSLRPRDASLRAGPAVTAREANRVAAQAQDDMERTVLAVDQQMADLVTRYHAGRVSAAVLSRGLRDILRRVYYEVFLLGAKASGNPRAVQGFTGFQPQEIQWIESALSTEMGFLDKLLHGIVTNKQRWTLGYMRNRLRRYAETAKFMFEAGKVAGSSPESVIRWVARGDRGTCRECLLLRDFGPYLRHTLPTTPKAGLTRCLNNCRCTIEIVPASAEQVRVLQATAYDRQYYLRLLQLSRSRPDNLPRVRGRQPVPPPRRRRVR